MRNKKKKNFNILSAENFIQSAISVVTEIIFCFSSSSMKIIKKEIVLHNKSITIQIHKNEKERKKSLPAADGFIKSKKLQNKKVSELSLGQKDLTSIDCD